MTKLLPGQKRVEIVGHPDGDWEQGWLHIPHGTSGPVAQRVIKEKIMAWLAWRERNGYRLLSRLETGGPFPPLEPDKVGYDLYVIRGRFRLEKPYCISLDTALANRDRMREYGVEPVENMHTALESDPWVPDPLEAEYYQGLKKEADRIRGTDNQD